MDSELWGLFKYILVCFLIIFICWPRYCFFFTKWDASWLEKVVIFGLLGEYWSIQCEELILPMLKKYPWIRGSMGVTIDWPLHPLWRI